MAFEREVWSKEAYLSKMMYAGKVLPSLSLWKPDMNENDTWHLPTFGALTGEVNAAGSKTTVTYTDAGSANSAIDLTTKNDLYKGFTVTDAIADCSDQDTIARYMKIANTSCFKKLERTVLLAMAIGCASGNRIELASGNQITLANLQTMKQNLLDNGAEETDPMYLVVNPEYLMNLQNVIDGDSTRIFLNRNKLDQNVLASGVVGMIEGFQVIMAHTMPTLNDAGTAYDASGETGLLYYSSEAMAVGMTKVARIDYQRDITDVPVSNKVLVHYYYGAAIVDDGLCGCAREYSA